VLPLPIFGSKTPVRSDENGFHCRDAKIADIQSQILPREQEYKTSLAQLSGTTTQSQASMEVVSRLGRPEEQT